MASRPMGDKPFSELMLTKFTDAYMRHYGEMSFNDTKTYFLNIWWNIYTGSQEVEINV